MNDHLPSVTVLIAARPGQAEIQAVTASRALHYPAEKLEILVARGRQPSAQRNAALKAARGELVYFLDDDSVPAAENLLRAAPRFAQGSIQMVGGPNLCPPGAPSLEQVFALVLGSWLAFGPSRARYSPVGQARESSEKELILCNLLARRDSMLELGGFNEALYPNEENALMDELQKRGGKLIYDPAFVVYRRPRASLGAFSRMLLTYGRGRAEQFREYPTLGSLLNFVPPVFCVFLLALVVTLVLRPAVGKVLLIPLGCYVLAVFAQAGALWGAQRPKPKGQSRVGPGGGIPPEPAAETAAPRGALGPDKDTEMRLARRVRRSVAATPLIVLTHVLYGVGFWRGLFTKLRSPGQRPPTEVVLERVTP